ncbi:hypothetical protein CIK81_14420 [Brachybacterium sp. JB7]|nr:hypothetical protein CIK81_14420 [Brachybacterium sp. JB7]
MVVLSVKRLTSSVAGPAAGCCPLLAPPPLSPRHPVTPSPRHPVTPSPRHPVTPSPRHPVTEGGRVLWPHDRCARRHRVMSQDFGDSSVSGHR